MMNTYMIPRKEVGPSTVPAKPAPDLKNETELSASASWDAPEAQTKKKHSPFGASATATGWALSDRFDRILPPHRRYYGRSRRTLLLAILALFLCLLALVVGLAVGLTRKSGGYVLSRLAFTSTVYYFRAAANPLAQPAKLTSPIQCQNMDRRLDLLRPRAWRLWH
jgi:hypothetical protein